LAKYCWLTRTAAIKSSVAWRFTSIDDTYCERWISYDIEKIVPRGAPN
jgi:hypothetical protein